ncbi:hypothetical protein [Cupriavidus sp. AcVe19-1a]|uniref:hypothetical protein n=1 Tax=Cupriavidus sp. AcVe19-1a TaxID=2821359 RepID=UPI001AE139BD|nr:hypothetical protein [Cupriavidus sp. AcVe19-1a]MBP0633463.1 hypothetical protein [Cupriavidus sp. AcVe19-1a]
MTSENAPLTELETARQEVLRRLGRNLLLFQQIEYCLKFVLARHKNGGTLASYQDNLQRRVDGINKQMLGKLVEQYGRDVLRDAGEPVPEEEWPDDWFSFVFRLSGSTEFIGGLRRDLKLMTDERNELVHHFLPRWQPASADKLSEALLYLDTQREKVLPMHEHLKLMIDQLIKSGENAAAYFGSPQYAQQSELLWLQESPLATFLCDVAKQVRRKDGWTYLAHAGTLAAKEIPEELKHLRERYGFKTLKNLLVGSDLFEIYDEPLAGERFRTLYRLKEQS